MKKGSGKSGAKADTIYERIGGEAAVRSAVKGLYDRILGDVVLSPFFAGVDTKHVQEQQVVFISQALGGPARYKGPAMRPLHAGMKIEQRHFDRVVHHLIASLKALEVDDATAEEIVNVIRPVGRDVVTVETGEDSMLADNREALIFKQLIENSPINVMRADTDLVIQYMNAASLKTLGQLAHLLPCPVDKVVGTNIDIFHKNPAHQRRIMSDPKNLPRQANIQLGPETLSLLVSPLFDAQQKYMGSMVTWEVITEKIRLKKETDEWAAQVSALQIFQAVVHYSMDGTILDGNENLLKLYGYSLDELKGKHYSSCLDPAGPDAVRTKEMWEKLNRGDCTEGEFKHIAKGGREVWVRGWYNVIKDSDGKPYKVIGYISDVTAARLAAADSEGQLSAISKSQAVIEFKMDGTVITANPIFLSTLGYNLDEIRGKHHSLFVDDVYRRSPEYTEFWAKLNRGENIATEFKRLGKGGKEVWLQASYNPIMDLNGKPFKVVKYATDITDAVKAREAVKVAAENDRLAAEEMGRKVNSILGVVAAAAEGDLTQEIAVKGNDAVGQMGEGLGKFFGDLRHSISSIGQTAKNLAHASEEVTAQGQQMSANSEETSAQANVVAKATQQVNENLQSVATGAEEMTLTVRSIASNASEAARVAGEAVKTAQAANDTVSKLGESSAEIGQVIKVITSIAQQTNLLALNATIEAARAGEAGKGFAVVANEVKELAKQTAKATEEISQKITTIQLDTKGAVEAIGAIGETINKINEISTTIATAVEEQSATTNEMSRNVAEAAKGSGEISQNIQGVAQAADGTAASAQGSQKSALQLAEMAAQLRALVERFKIEGGESGKGHARAASASR